MSNATSTTEFNPLMARKNQSRTLRLGAIAASALIGATLLLSAAVSAEPKVTLKPALAGETSVQLVAVAAPAAEAQSRPAKQVRVIPLWNTPKDQQGL